MNMLDRLPKYFFEVKYNYEAYPGNANGFDLGANCQHYCFEILRYFNFEIENLRSSELTTDKLFTTSVDKVQPLDLVLVHEREESYGAHVGICISDKEEILHLSKSNGFPKVVYLNDLMKDSKYKKLVGIKRPIMQK